MNEVGRLIHVERDDTVPVLSEESWSANVQLRTSESPKKIVISCLEHTPD